MFATPRIGYAPRGNGTHIGYSVLGEGPPLIFWAGGMIHASALFDEPRVARSQREMAGFSTRICLDRLGMGYSDPLPPGDIPTLERQGGDVLAVLDHLGIDSAIVMANTWDGQALMRLAIDHPDRVDKLILMATTPCPTSRPDWPYGMPADILEAVQAELNAPGQGLGRESGELLKLIAPSSADDPELASWLDEGGRAAPVTAKAYVDVSLQTDIRESLPLIQQPTLILHSTHDAWIPVEVPRWVATQIPNAQLVEFDSADHLFFTDLLEERMAALEAFVEGEARAHSQRRLLTVLFTDVVGSTERLAETRDVRWTAMLDEIDSTVVRQVRRHEGRVCKSMGDGHLALFDRPSDAVAAALALVRALSRLGAPIRAGVHIGEVELRGDDVAGVAVHVGARVSGKAVAGEVLVTRTVGDLLAGSPYLLEPAGEHELKGLAGTWPLFRVLSG